MIMIMYMNKSCREQLSKEVVVPTRSIDCCKDLQVVAQEVQSGYVALRKRYRVAMLCGTRRTEWLCDVAQEVQSGYVM